VAEDALDIAQFLTVIEGMRGECMANGVRGDVRDVNRLSVRLQDQPEALPRQPASTMIEEDRVDIGILTQERPASIKVFAERFRRRL